MCRRQKTLDNYGLKDRAEPEEEATVALNASITESDVREAYHNLMPFVIADENIDRAMEQVVGNRGAPGVDGMTVDELEPWLKTNREELKDQLMSGCYVPIPVRRKEIPKDNGGVRKLGIPSVVDRLVQQMIAQVLVPIYDPTFSDSSYGFRPGRSAVDAVMKVRDYYDQGYVMAVGIDLERFFDTLGHDFLMNILRERIKDKVLILTIKRFLRSGVAMPDGLVHPTPEGAPQGGPLSPLLSNIYLDRLDRELESRGLPFVRFADDSLIMVRSPRAAERVCESVTRFIEGELKLKVNREKTEIGSPRTLKFLGFKLARTKKGTGLTPHPKSIKRFKKRVRALTKRNRGVSVERMLGELASYMRGWIGYFGATTSDNVIKVLDEWVRRRVRQYILKSWKKRYNKFRRLRSLCPEYFRMPDGSVAMEWVHSCWACAMDGSPWHASSRKASQAGLTKRKLADMGMYYMMDDWKAVEERWTNRRLPSRGTTGGVRGQPMG